MTTGNLYTQLYDPALGKYLEIQPDIKPIQVIATTGAFNTKLFLPYTGISIDSINTKRLVMYPIDLGSFNVASGNGINIGVSNFSIDISPTGYFNVGPGLLNIGESNLISGVSSVNIGNSISKINSWYSYTLGESNQEKDTAQIYTLGRGNSISGVVWAKVLGLGNTLYRSSTLPSTGIDVWKIILVGDGNNLQSGVNSSSIIGNNNNVVKGVKNLTVLGDLNSIESVSGEQNIALGYSNIYNTGLNCFILGNQNQIFNSDNQYLFGSSNIISTGVLSNNIVGSYNTLSKSGNLILGNQNEVDSRDNNINGNVNTLVFNSFENIVFGDENNLSGATYNSIIGSRNLLDRTLIDNIYGVYLTGVGFSGTYITGGFYFGVGINGGSSNFIVGDDNLGTLNNGAYVFGDSNEVLNNLDSYVLGSENYMERAIDSFVLGNQNTVSGTQNYVIGNNNSIRSGDYNSILIGISHEFTGDFKVASIGIGSVDSEIEINPSEIKLASPTRVKFNNENMLVSSDLNNYLNSSNGLSNSGVYNSFIINDPNYTNLAAQIELQSFGYSGIEDRYHGDFSGFNTSDPKAYNFSGFFRKQPALYYGGLHSIYGNYYYQSSNENFEILFSRDIEPVTGNWIISPKNSLGVLFYNPSTNTGVFPISSWLVTGANTVTGYNPAPSFTYSSTFTGFFEKQRINSSTTYTSNYFNNFGAVSYPSPAGSDIAVIYGNHNSPQFNPTWLVIDKYSSGVYYVNKVISSTVTPQTGWTATGFAGYSGVDPQIPNTGIKISLGTRSGIISSYDPTYGKIYIPFYY